MLITDGILRMRNRNGYDHWEFMDSGEIYKVEVDLWTTSYIWNTGHKIRIAISSSNYPRFLNNPNTDDPMAQNTTYNVAQNKVYMDSIHPSCIIIPEIEGQLLDKNPNIYNYNDDSKTLRGILNNKFEGFIQNMFKLFVKKDFDPFDFYKLDL